MNKLLLVSVGLGALPEFIRHDPKTLRLIFIPTAGNTSKDPWWVGNDRKILKKMGFKFSEFDIEGKTTHQLGEALTSDVNLVYVAGGNTFYLLDMMNRCGFAHRMSVLLNSGAQYIGGSAGAVVVGPNIEPIHTLDDQEDAPGLKSTKGLGLVDFVTIPHINQFQKSKIDQIQKEYGEKYKLVPINDDQSVVVDQHGVFKIVESKQI